jgi:hypothetical protein
MTRLLPGVISSSGAVSAYTVEGSLRFNYADSSYLVRFPTDSGNRRTWTWSAWVKLSNIASDINGVTPLFAQHYSSGTSSRDYIQLYENKIWVDFNNAGSGSFRSTRLLRDPSAWYHLVMAVDTTQATSTNRLKFYVNGEQVAWSSETYPSQNYETAINLSGTQMRIGGQTDGSYYVSGYLAEVNFIDGLQLTPSSFGQNNSTTNAWEPKEYTGSYGTNGFYLPFNSRTSVTSLGFDPNRATESRGNATVTGSAVLSTAQSKFGGSSLYQPTATGSPVNFRTGINAAQDFLFTGDFTIEGWVYPVSGPDRSFYVSHDGSTYFAFNYSMTANVFNLYLNSGGPTSPSFTFSSQWYHFALSRSGTGSNNLKLFVNGNIVWQSTNNSSLGYANPTLNRIGGGAGSDPQYVDDFRIYNGVGKYTTTFTPPTSALPIGTEDPYWSSVVLAVPADGSNNSTTIPTYSGNYLSPVNFSVSAGVGNDALLDSPTDSDITDTGIGGQVIGNYCTLNPADTNSPLTLTNGGLQFADAGSDGWNIFKGTMGVTSGKWYWEVTPTAINAVFCVSVASAEAAVDVLPGQVQGYGVTLYNSGGVYREGNSNPVETVTGYSNGNVVGVALDMDNGKVWFSVNGTFVNSGNPVAGTNAQSTTLKNYSSVWMPAVGTYYANSNGIVNFGQRPFAYTAPTGFKTLCTANLPTPSITRPETVFETVLYSGNSNAAYSVSGLNFSPDFVWIKNRTLSGNGSSDHMVFDTIRGAQNFIKTNSTDTQGSGSNFLTAFTSDGFTPGTSTRTNETGSNYAAWVWDAGSATVTNNDGSVTSNVRVNQTAGFSVVQYNTGSNANTYTVGHGLGAVPRFIMIKGGYTTDTYNWDIYHAEYSPTQRLKINSSDALETQGGPWDDQRPSSTVIYQDNQNNYWYGTNRNNIAYCFTDVPGYSRFGRWTNNNSTNGTFVNLGFRPKMILLKNTDNVEQWYILDSKRHTINVAPPDGKNFQPSTANSEGQNNATTATIDFLSNGFKIRTTNAASGEISFGTRNYVYAAFAESPFKYARAR